MVLQKKENQRQVGAYPPFSLILWPLLKVYTKQNIFGSTVSPSFSSLETEVIK